MVSRELTWKAQTVEVYAHLPRIRHPDGSRKIVDNADLWFASKVNATLKKGSASDTYWEKHELDNERIDRFVTGVRNHSWNRQHMGAMVVGGVDFEASVSSLLSSTFALGKFYKMQQQTRRSVILDEVVVSPELAENEDVRSNYQQRFKYYWDVVDRRPDKVKGFDPIIQDVFKILPLATHTRMAGTLDLRTAKGMARWKQPYLPSAIRDFAAKLNSGCSEEYPIMFQSFRLDEQNRDNDEMYGKQLQMIDSIGSVDLMDEPLLWYADHSFLLPENRYFDRLYHDFRLDRIFKDTGSDAMLLGHFNPLGIGIEDIVELFKNKDEAGKTAMELTSFAFVSKIDMSGGIDTWRHTRSNRIVQPIYHALDNSPVIAMPELYQRKQRSGESADHIVEMSTDAISLYHQLVGEGVSKAEAINVLPHTLELIQVEMMDVFSFLNIMAIRTCIHARPDVQNWAKALLREVGKIVDFRGLDQLSDEQSNLLARGIVFSYCAELGNCKKCGKDVVYLPDPLRG